MGEVDPWMSKVNGDFIEREMGADLGGGGGAQEQQRKPSGLSPF